MKIKGIEKIFSKEPPKGDPAFLPAIKSKPKTKEHFEELLAHHSYHSDAWHKAYEGKAHSIADRHAKIISAIESEAQKHYYPLYKKHIADNKFYFRNLFDNMSNTRVGSSAKTKAEKKIDDFKKHIKENLTMKTPLEITLQLARERFLSEAKLTPEEIAHRRIIKDHIAKHVEKGSFGYSSPGDIADGAYRGLSFGTGKRVHPSLAQKIAREVFRETKISKKPN